MGFSEGRPGDEAQRDKITQITNYAADKSDESCRSCSTDPTNGTENSEQIPRTKWHTASWYMEALEVGKTRSEQHREFLSMAFQVASEKWEQGLVMPVKLQCEKSPSPGINQGVMMRFDELIRQGYMVEVGARFTSVAPEASSVHERVCKPRPYLQIVT